MCLRPVYQTENSAKLPRDWFSIATLIGIKAIIYKIRIRATSLKFEEILQNDSGNAIQSKIYILIFPGPLKKVATDKNLASWVTTMKLYL